MEEDVIRELEQAEEMEIKETLEGLSDNDREWEQKKRQERRSKELKGVTAVCGGEPVKRGAGSKGRGQGGKPSKTRKFSLLDRNWGKETAMVEDDQIHQSLKEPWEEEQLLVEEQDSVELLHTTGSIEHKPENVEPEVGSKQPPPPEVGPPPLESRPPPQSQPDLDGGTDRGTDVPTDVSDDPQPIDVVVIPPVRGTANRSDKEGSNRNMSGDPFASLTDDRTQVDRVMSMNKDDPGSDMRVLIDGDDDPSTSGVKDVKTNTTPPVEKTLQQLECEILRGKWCNSHGCEVTSVKTSSKTWVWLDKQKKYGWKYKGVKKYHCRAKGVVNRAAKLSTCNGEKAGDMFECGGNSQSKSQIMQE